MSSSTIADTVGRWGESLDDFSDDEENIVPITEDDGIHLLDADDVETIVADANEGNDLMLKTTFGARLSLGLGWEMSSLFGVMLDQRPSNQYLAIQLMNRHLACMT
ncbi:hypothetical protein V6N13_050609 [Hibiscus sabdariffa]|uniref:Uncharacterized protein n=1 Tax=Hibiscus sabdariffa TaxID=183260 RepID=A0ABR2PHT6_9ROSI